MNEQRLIYFLCFSFYYLFYFSLLHLSPPDNYKLLESNNTSTYYDTNSYTPPQDGEKTSYSPILLHRLLKDFSAKPLVKISAN